jgi:hypothetical protein
MTFHGSKNCAIDHFVKFGGGDAMQHNCAMPKKCIYISITSYLLASVNLAYP